MEALFFSCNPWDLADEGYQLALGRLAGEIGVDAVSVAALTNDVICFRPRIVDGPRTIHVEAGAHFQPSEAFYANTRIRPVTSPWIKSRNPLAKIAELAAANSLSLRVDINACRCRRLIERFPWSACVDMFGDSGREWLCAAHPEVREFLAALVQDLTSSYPIETIEITNAILGGGACAEFGLALPVDFPLAESILRMWCFCAACRQRAMDVGVDIEAARRSAVELIERLFRLESPRFSSFEDLLDGNADLAAYHRMRMETVTSLARMLRERTKARLVYHVAPASMTGADARSLAGFCDGIVMPWNIDRGTCGVHTVGPDDVLSLAGGPSKVDALFNPSPARVKDGAMLVSHVHRASQAGHKRIGFYSYGLLPEISLEWVRQAIRYARREG